MPPHHSGVIRSLGHSLKSKLTHKLSDKLVCQVLLKSVQHFGAQLKLQSIQVSFALWVMPPHHRAGTFMCCHGACRCPLTWPPCSLHGLVIRVCPIARMYASVTVLGRWDRFHSLPPAATPGTFMCCHAAFMGVSFVCVPSPGCTRV